LSIGIGGIHVCSARAAIAIAGLRGLRAARPWRVERGTTVNQQRGVASLERALTIVGSFTVRDRGITLAEIAARTGFYKSTVLRLCASLEKFGYVIRLNDGRFVLGGALFRLGQIYQRSFNLADYVVPVLQQLTLKTGLSASLWIKEENFRVCLFRAEAAEGVRDLSAQVGERWPLDRGGSASTVLLAYSSAKAARFARVRKAGIAVSLGEFVPELAAISAPVLSSGGALIGAVSLGGFRSHFSAAATKKLRPLVLAAAREISLSLGRADTPARPPLPRGENDRSRRL
jgi:DNA-binding IclR family transcriptional regulator